MNKTTIKQAMKDYQRALTEYNAKVKEINESHSYTDSGKREQLSALATEYKPRINEASRRAKTEFDSALDKLQRTRSAEISRRMNDGAYQTALQNAVSMIQHGAITSKNDLQAISDNFKGDPLASSLLRGALNGSGKTDFANLIPEDKAAEASKTLSEISGRLSAMARRAESGESVSDLSIAFVGGYADRLDDLFDDDMNPI